MARVNVNDKRCHSAHMVEKAFTTVPKRVVLYDRQSKPAMPLEEALKEHQPEPLPDHVKTQLRKIVQRTAGQSARRPSPGES